MKFGVEIKTNRGWEQYEVVEAKEFNGRGYIRVRNLLYGEQYPDIILNDEMEVQEYNHIGTLEDWWNN